MTTDESLYLPEHLENPFIAPLPPLMSPQQATAALTEEPHFNPQLERSFPDQLRRACIMRLTQHFFTPLRRHLDLNERIGQVLREGYDGRNISTGTYFKHLQDNRERVIRRDLEAKITSARSTATALSLVGCSGIGKTETISRILRTYPQVIQHDEPYSLQQVVWLKLECPHMGSAKQLCLDFLASMDALLATSYFRQYHRASLDLLSSQMGAIASRHGLGLMVIDEIQNLLNGRGKDQNQLMNFLLNLINKIGIPLLFVGTLAAIPLLNNTVRNARRASGLGSILWERLDRRDGWDHFITELWRFQWTREPTALTPEIIDCLYEETQGILDLAVKLFILAQFYAIDLSADNSQKHGQEQLTIKLLRHVAKANFKLLEKMLLALKHGDREAIAAYDDIRPFHDHIREIFYRTKPPRGGETPPPVPVVQPGPSELQDNRQQVRTALVGLGIAPDTAEILLDRALADVGLNDPIALVSAALAQLQSLPQGAAAPPMANKVKRVPNARQGKPDLTPDDLRFIVAQGRENEKSAYDALAGAGLIVPVDQLYRVS
jgi:hypothetical protein